MMLPRAARVMLELAFLNLLMCLFKLLIELLTLLTQLNIGVALRFLDS